MTAESDAELGADAEFDAEFDAVLKDPEVRAALRLSFRHLRHALRLMACNRIGRSAEARRRVEKTKKPIAKKASLQ